MPARHLRSADFSETFLFDAERVRRLAEGAPLLEEIALSVLFRDDPRFYGGECESPTAAHPGSDVALAPLARCARLRKIVVLRWSPSEEYACTQFVFGRGVEALAAGAAGRSIEEIRLAGEGLLEHGAVAADSVWRAFERMDRLRALDVAVRARDARRRRRRARI